MATSDSEPDALHVASSPDFSLEELHKDAREMEAVLARGGISIPPSSRVWQYLHQLQILEDYSLRGQVSGTPDARILHQGVADLLELVAIVKELARPPAVPGWQADVARLLSGSPTPGRADRSTPERDWQFQLWLGAIARRAGYEVSLAEPDVVLHGGSFPLGIAAKRVRSAKKLDHHFKKASRQIEITGHCGVIAMDLSVLFNPRQQAFTVNAREETLRVVREAAVRFVETNKYRIRRLAGPGNVLGVVVLAKALFYVQPGKVAPAMHAEWANLCRTDDPRYPEFRSLVERFARAATA